MISKIKKMLPYNMWVRKMWWRAKGVLAYAKNNKLLKWIKLVWVSWTDWKTTTTNFASQLLQKLWVPTAMMSSEVYSINWKIYPNKSKQTTSSPFEIFEFISKSKKAWCKVIILEVSSHSIEQGRVYWFKFDYSIITNLSHEHLDYHWTMQSYAETKAKLCQNTSKCVIIPKNLNQKNIFEKNTNCRILETYVWDKNQDINILNANNLRFSNHWTHFDLHYKGQTIHDIYLPVIWNYNVENLMFAIWLETLIERETVWITLKEAVWMIEKVPWRLDELNYGQDYRIWISFAVTPMALEKTLKYAQEVKEESWKVWIVFWATGGQHDRHKRPVMWEVAGIFADFSIITDDETYWEDSMSIIRDVQKWIIWTDWDYTVIQDRKEAILFALDNAKAWDIVLISWVWNFESRNMWEEMEWNERKIIREHIELT